MRVYLELARLAFHQQLAYRSATLAGLFTNSVFGVTLAPVMLGFYGSVPGEPVQCWSSSDAVTLIWINQALIMPVYLWGWWGVSASIGTGAIASDLLRPISWYGFWTHRSSRHRRDLHCADHLLLRHGDAAGNVISKMYRDGAHTRSGRHVE